MRHPLIIWKSACFAFLALAGTGLKAQELSILGGQMNAPSLQKSTYAFELDYRQDFSRVIGSSLVWLNEGHVPGHKRDGTAWEAWLTWPTLNDHLTFSLGAGPYYFFDTVALGGGAFADLHGTAPMYSFAATYFNDDRWFARVIVNRITPSHDIATNIAAAGFGVWLGRGSRPQKGKFFGPRGEPFVTGSEFTVFYGKSVENSLADAKTSAAAVEFRAGLFSHLDGTLSYIYEGDPKVIRRNGGALQFWPVNAFRNGSFTVGMGIGIYASIDRKSIARVKTYQVPAVSPIISPTFSVRLSEDWLLRVVFNRVVSYGHADSDVFLLGLGHRWR